ncbi:hypothetical protein WJX81_002243 [Elliptochloris bilobata]|uniref:RNA polymerase Rpb4/RPC9 core domain-containing protein n=1 Tax=Elliptochloris bilobata TaxID=381761 RepID=A0AAW1QZ05_9CHLO
MTEQQPEEEENAAELKLGSVFHNATALSNSEAAMLMNIVLETRKQEEAAYVPNPVMQKTLEYAERFSTARTRAAAISMKQVLVDAELMEFEIGCVANLMPENAEEAKFLIPSLDDARFANNDEALDTALSNVALYKDT